MVSEVGRQMINTVFDPIFIGMMLLIIYMYKRIKNRSTNDVIKMGIKDTARGIILGIIASHLMVKVGIIIPFKYNLLILIPTAITLMIIDVKWGCFSYIIPLIYFTSRLLLGIGFRSDLLELPFKELIVLVGVLHLLEGILVFWHGDEAYYEVPLYKDGVIVKGKSSNKFWPIPLFIFKVAGAELLIPIYGVLGYGDVAFYKTPKQKARYMGSLLVSYGGIVMVLGISILKGIVPLIIGMSVVPMFHEFLFILSKWYDKRL